MFHRLGQASSIQTHFDLAPHPNSRRHKKATKKPRTAKAPSKRAARSDKGSARGSRIKRKATPAGVLDKDHLIDVIQAGTGSTKKAANLSAKKIPWMSAYGSGCVKTSENRSKCDLSRFVEFSVLMKSIT